MQGILKDGAGVNDCPHDKRSALHVAAAAGHRGVVELLIQEGADVMCNDIYGFPPLADALRGGHQEVRDMLLAAGAGGVHPCVASCARALSLPNL